MNLQDFRSQYPEYNDLDDDTLSHSLWRRYYGDMPYGDFLDQVAPAAQPSFGDRALGTLSGMGQSALEGISGVDRGLGDLVAGAAERLGLGDIAAEALQAPGPAPQPALTPRSDIAPPVTPPSAPAGLSGAPTGTLHVEPPRGPGPFAPWEAVGHVLPPAPAAPVRPAPAVGGLEAYPVAPFTPDLAGETIRRLLEEGMAAQPTGPVLEPEPGPSGLRAGVNALLGDPSAVGPEDETAALLAAQGRREVRARYPVTRPSGTPVLPEHQARAIGAREGVLERGLRDVGAGAIATGEGMLGYVARLGGDERLRKAQGALGAQAATMMPRDPAFLDKLAAGFGSTATFFVPGLGIMQGARAAALVAPRMATWLGVGASSGMEAAAEAGATYAELRERGKGHQEAARIADRAFWANAAVLAVTNRLGLFGTRGGQLARRSLAAVMEGTQEAAQSGIGNVATDRPVTEGMGEAAAIGTIVGGALGGAAPRPTREQELAHRLEREARRGGQFSGEVAEIVRRVLDAQVLPEGDTVRRIVPPPAEQRPTPPAEVIPPPAIEPRGPPVEVAPRIEPPEPRAVQPAPPTSAEPIPPRQVAPQLPPVQEVAPPPALQPPIQPPAAPVIPPTPAVPEEVPLARGVRGDPRQALPPVPAEPGREPEPGAARGVLEEGQGEGGQGVQLEVPRPGEGAAPQGVEPSLEAVIEFARTGPGNEKRATRYRVVDEAEAARIREATGLEVGGYTHSLDNFAVRHILGQHGNPGTEEPRGQVAVTSEDIARIPEIVSEYDSVERMGEVPGPPRILYAKRYDGTTYYVEEQRTGLRELAAVTMWKRRDGGGPRSAPGATPEGGVPQTSETFARKPATEGSVPEAPPGRPLSEITLTERVVDETGAEYEVSRPATEVLAERDQRVSALSALLDCLAA